MDCTFTAPSRKPGPKKQRSYANIEGGVNNTQDHVRQLEAIIQQLTDRLEAAEGGWCPGSIPTGWGD